MKRKQKILILLSIVLFVSAFSIINNVFLVFGQTTYPQWRGTSNIKAPILAENLDYLYNQVNNTSGSTVTQTLLWSGVAQINSSNLTVDIPLNDSWRNYDALVIVSNHNGWTNLFTHNYLLTAALNNGDYILQSGLYPNSEPFLIKVVNDTTLQNIAFWYNGYSNHTVRAVYGIKY